MKFKTYVCIQEDCGEICKHESVLDGDRHPKPPEFCPYYGGPCTWEEFDCSDAYRPGSDEWKQCTGNKAVSRGARESVT